MYPTPIYMLYETKGIYVCMITQRGQEYNLGDDSFLVDGHIFKVMVLASFLNIWLPSVLHLGW